MNPEERILRRIPLEILGFSLAVACVSLFLFSPRTGLFVLAGGAFSAASFLWLKQVEAHFHNHMLHTAAELGIPGSVDSIPLGAKPGIFFWVSLALIAAMYNNARMRRAEGK